MATPKQDWRYPNFEQWSTIPGGGIYYDSGNVSIGTSTNNGYRVNVYGYSIFSNNQINQSNGSDFFTSSYTKSIVIGTKPTNVYAPLTINQNSSANTFLPRQYTAIHLISQDGIDLNGQNTLFTTNPGYSQGHRITFDAFGDINSSIDFRRARGVMSNPSQPLNSDPIVAINAMGWFPPDSSFTGSLDYGNRYISGAYNILAEGDWSDSPGTRHTWSTTYSGDPALSVKMTLSGNGILTVPLQITTGNLEAVTVNKLSVSGGPHYENEVISIGDTYSINNSGYQQQISIGWSNLRANITGGLNIAIGKQVLQSIGSGGSNIGIGDGALRGNTSGSFNIGIGSFALSRSGFTPYGSTGYGNIGIGYATGNNITSGQYNIALGFISGYNITTGYNNTLIGYQAGYNITTGISNVVIGSAQLSSSINYNIVLSDGAGNIRYQWNGTTNNFFNQTITSRAIIGNGQNRPYIGAYWTTASPNISANATDIAGSINFYGSGATGNQVYVAFSAPYTYGIPSVILQTASSTALANDGSPLQVWVDANTNGFTIYFNNVCSNYCKFNYIVIGTS